MFKKTIVVALGISLFAGCGVSKQGPSDAAAVIQNYSDMAYAIYDDSVIRAADLSDAISTLIDTPSEEALTSARAAWISVREPYMQSEAYRFGNPIVDAFDMRLNAWPLDESFIDYVAPSPLAAFGVDDGPSVNIIASTNIKYGGIELDATDLTKAFLSDTLHELGGNEAHVATGFHAIEFLLWGQDLNSETMTAGTRPASDFDLVKCTNPPCERRIAYLKAATELLIDDLISARDAWSDSGAARLSLSEIPSDEALGRIFHSLGSLAYGELAGERMKLGLMLKDPEEEHDCFADNTHNAHYYNALGLSNVWLGKYIRTDGSIVEGLSLADLVAKADPNHAEDVDTKLKAVMVAFSDLKARGETVEHYDQMITGTSSEGPKTVEKAINALIELANGFERAAVKLDLGAKAFEGSDSLDAPQNVQAQ